MGVVDVIYRPLTHLLHIGQDVIDAFVNTTIKLTGVDPETGFIQLSVMEALETGEFLPSFTALQAQFPNENMESIISTIQGLDTTFMGFNLANVPMTTGGIYYAVPVVAGLTALLLCVVQNKIQVLQAEQGKFSQIGMTVFSVGLSLFFK